MAVTRPTTDDLIGWLNLRTPLPEGVQAQIDEAFNTAASFVESRINLPEGTTDSDYPQLVRTAILLTAARLNKRVGSPEGVAGSPEVGFIRISRFDPDVESLLSRYLKLDGFA